MEPTISSTILREVTNVLNLLRAPWTLLPPRPYGLGKSRGFPATGPDYWSQDYSNNMTYTI